MDFIMKNVSAYLRNSFELPFSKPVLFKFNTCTHFNLEKISSKKCRKGYLTPAAQEIVKMAKNYSEKSYMKRYEAVLNQFLNQLIVENSDLTVITKYVLDHTKFIMTKSQKINLVIPQLTKLPVKNLDTSGMQSISFLLEEIAFSGFETIMINGETWQTLTRQNFPESGCNLSSCRPKNVLYLNDMHNAFSAYTQNSIVTLLEAGGMYLSGLIFSGYYDDSKVLSWDSAVTSLQAAVKLKRGKLATVETGCTEHTDIFGTLLNLDTFDTICDALELHKVFGCHSLGTTSNIIVWRGVLRLKKYNTENFVENTMKKLDALILGRQMLQNQYQDLKQVILRVKVEYAKEGNIVIRHPIYCTNIGIKVYQLYELLLTWAQIYEFPIILEPINSVTGYPNPITWQQLKMQTHGPMQNLMESFPIFIRRSYNQSVVFGSWNKGMYPCINLSKDKESVKEIKFSNEFLGVSVRLNLRRDNTSLTIDELQTILLLALGKFTKTEIILQTESEFQLVYDTVTSDNFSENLKLNNITQRKIYLNIDTDFSANKTDNIFEIKDKLKKDGFQIYINVLNTNTLKFRNLINVSIGLVLENCTEVAQNLIMNPNNNLDLKNMEYLICETDNILADNINLTAMQDYLESHLYLKKIFQYFYPNLKEIHFRLHPNLVGDTFVDQLKNLFLFLSDITKYANSYKIHYFILDALSTEIEPDFVSFWKTTNYQNLTDINSIVEPLVTFLNVTSWQPVIKSRLDETSVTSSTIIPTTEVTTTYFPSTEISSSTTTPATTTKSNPTLSSYTEVPSPLPVTIKTSVLSPNTTIYTTTPSYYTTDAVTNVTVLSYQQMAHSNQLKSRWMESTSFQYIMITILLVAFVAILIAIKSMQNRRYLTTKEVNDFIHGRLETLEQAARRRKRHTINNFNVFDGLVYQKEFEVSIRNIKMNRMSSYLTYSGMFSKVCIGKIKGRENNISVEICKTRTSKTYFMAMLSEVKMLCYVGSHDNIVQFVGSYTKEIRKGILWIITEFSPDDSLECYMKKFKEDISYKKMVRFSKEIATGMEYLSTQSIIHGDLRSKHVYMNQSNKTCKIGNFGLNRKLLEYQTIIQTGNFDLLPWRWMAVESLKNLEFSTQSDVWSYGITLWEILSSGNLPYGEDVVEKTALIKMLKEGKILECPYRASPATYQIMKQCWVLDPKQRPDFAKLVNFFSDLLSTFKDETML